LLHNNEQVAFSSSTLLVGWQKEHFCPVKMSNKVLVWLSVYSEMEQSANDLHVLHLMPLPANHLASLKWLCLSGTSLPMLSWKRGR